MLHKRRTHRKDTNTPDRLGQTVWYFFEVAMKRLPIKHLRSLIWLPSLAGFGLILLAGLGQAQPTSQKLPEPAKEIQAQKQNDLFNAHKEAFAKKSDPFVARALADTMLRLARQTNNDPALRYVALVTARDLAGAAGDIGLALGIIDEIATQFTTDTLSMKAVIVQLAIDKTTAKEEDEAIVALALSMLEDALAQDNYGAGDVLVKAGTAAAAKAQSDTLASKVKRAAQDLQQARKEFGRMAPIIAVLAQTPDDPAANVAMGRYQCLVKGNWDKGLPMLLKGQDKVYGGLASRDLAAPKEPPGQLDLGDEYAALAGNEKGLTQKMLLKRALHWYAMCLPALPRGLSKVRVDKAVEDISKLFPAAPEISIGAAMITKELRMFDRAHVSGIQSLAVSADGKQVLSGGIQDPVVRLWDFEKGNVLRQFAGHKDEIQGLAFSLDGKTIASASSDQTMKTWSAANGNLLHTHLHKDWARGVFFMPDKKTIITASDDFFIRIWDLANGNVVKQMTGHRNFINGFAITKDATRAVTGSDDKTVRVWDLVNGKEIAQFSHNSEVWPVAISPDGKKVASAAIDSNVYIWDVDKKVLIRKIPLPTRVWSMALSPDGRVLVLGTGGGINQIPKEINFGPNKVQFGMLDNSLYLWEFESGKFLRRLTGHTNFVRAVVWTPDGRNVISAGQDNTIRVWGEGKKT
jgi:hypothetical protein